MTGTTYTPSPGHQACGTGRGGGEKSLHAEASTAAHCPVGTPLSSLTCWLSYNDRTLPALTYPA